MARQKIIVAVTGSIAAYKAAILIRLLVKEGHDVRVVMTPSAKNFISALTLSTLSKHTVYSDINDGENWNNHVELGLWADLMIVAPATANTLAKMANGICDTMLLATFLSAKCPVWLAPAMDLDMWQHPATQKNIASLSSMNTVTVLDVGHGELASGLIGPGRMAEPEEIVTQLNSWLKKKTTLADLNVMITAGPTREHIDPVRFIANPSTGTMGISIANSFASRGAKVTLIAGPISLQGLSPSVEVVSVISAEEMYEASRDAFDDTNVACFTAAVADYTPESASKQKIKKSEDSWALKMKRTTDIAATLGQVKRPDQVTIGFALETNDEEINALSKLERKNFNFIVLNSLKDKGAGFGSKTNRITIYDDERRSVKSITKSKAEIAEDIVEYYCNHYHK